MSKFWQKKYISKYTGEEIDAAVEKAGDLSKVEANPTLAGTESALEGLQVGETKYKVGGGISIVDFPAFPGTIGMGILTFISSATTSLTSKAFDVSGAVADYIEVFGGFDMGEIFAVNYPNAQLNSSLGIIAGKNPGDSFIVSSTVMWADMSQVIFKLDIDLYVDITGSSATLTLGVVKSTATA